MTLTPLVTVIHDLPPQNPSPGSHGGAKSLALANLSLGGHFLKINPYFAAAPTGVLLGFDIHTGKQNPLVW